MDEIISVIKKEQTQVVPTNNVKPPEVTLVDDTRDHVDDTRDHVDDTHINTASDKSTVDTNINDKSTVDYSNNDLHNIIDTSLKELIELSKNNNIYHAILDKIYYYFNKNNIFQFQHALTFLLERIPNTSDIPANIIDKLNFLLPKIRYYIAMQQDLYICKLVDNNNLSSLETLITDTNKIISDNIDEYTDEIVDDIDTVNRNFTDNFTIITDTINKTNQKIDQLLAKLSYSPVPIEDKTREAIVNIKQSIEDIYSKISTSNTAIATYLSTIKDQLNKLPADKSTDNIKDIQNTLEEFSDKLDEKLDNINIKLPELKLPEIPNIPKDISRYILICTIPSIVTLFILLFLIIK